MTVRVPKGLIIKHPWIDLILAGNKVWEMRSNAARYRGLFGLILQGTKTVVGVAELVNVHGPLTRDQLTESFDRHSVPDSGLERPGHRPWRYAWELANARRLKQPVSYTHKSEVRWVVFSEEVVDQIQVQIPD